MSEPQEPRRFPQSPPGAPLPRIWKVEPEPEPEVEAPKKKKSSGGGDGDPPGGPKKPSKKAKSEKKKGTPKSGDGEKKGVLIEETPTLDTYQARQTARAITGVAIAVVFCLGLFLIYRMFLPSGPAEEPIPEEPNLVQNAPGTLQSHESEARNLYDRARELAKNGKPQLAVSLLEKVTQAYPKTRAALDARQALDRPKQNLPLFIDRPTVIASPSEPAPAPSPVPAPEPSQVVQTARAAAPAVGEGEATLVAPAEARMAVSTVAPSGSSATPAKTLPRGFQTRPGSRIHPSGWPLELVGDRDGAPMVLVPGGTFTEGRDDGESIEAPAHQVSLGTYYMDQHEVTNRQFDLFSKEAGARRDRDRALAKEREKEKEGSLAASDDAPVVMVNARDAKDYATWAGKKLPTEAQWEAAARSPDARLFPWGNDPPGDKARKSREVGPIRSFPLDLSPYGVFDLAGNAWEWTKDWYDPHYFHAFKSAVADNPVGPVKPKTEQLTVKGGAKNWVVTKREGLKWSTRLPYLGFRCVLQVEGPDNVFEPPPTAAPGQPTRAKSGANAGVIPF